MGRVHLSTARGAGERTPVLGAPRGPDMPCEPVVPRHGTLALLASCWRSSKKGAAAAERPLLSTGTRQGLTLLKKSLRYAQIIVSCKY